MRLKPSLLMATLLCATGLLVTAKPLPANAYEVFLNGRTAGNPGGALYDVTLNSAYDVGRTLDPTSWYVPAGTSNGTETTPIALSAVMEITVKELTSGLLKLAITITNTTQVPTLDYRAVITSFGFGVSPNATGASVNGSSVFDIAQVSSGQQSFAGGFKQIDVCIFADGCKGGDVKTGLQAGASTSLELSIFGSFWDANKGTNFVTLSDFPLKFQTQNGSYEPAGVPEPTTMIGSGLAIGFGALYKKKLEKKRKDLAKKA